MKYRGRIDLPSGRTIAVPVGTILAIYAALFVVIPVVLWVYAHGLVGVGWFLLILSLAGWNDD